LAARTLFVHVAQQHFTCQVDVQETPRMDLSALTSALSLRPAETRLLVLTDFDGTLVELAQDPDSVELSTGRRDLVRTLARQPDLTLGVVSGRRLADVRLKVGVEGGIYYAGLHGLEIEGPGIHFLHSQTAGTRALIQRLGRRLIDATKDLVGVRVENKELTLAMHVRGAASAAEQRAEDIFREIAGPYIDTGTLRILCGDAVFELLPGFSWTRGDAVLRIKAEVERRYRRESWLIYLGDDVTDDDAFGAVGTGGMTIAVGDRPATAAFRLPDPDAVERFLRQLTLTEP
jgi:trehalose-phosphatase